MAMNLWCKEPNTPGRDQAARVETAGAVVRVGLWSGSTRNAEPMTADATIDLPADIARVMAGQLIAAAEAAERT